jgi:hypothetical protein
MVIYRSPFCCDVFVPLGAGLFLLGSVLLSFGFTKGGLKSVFLLFVRGTPGMRYGVCDLFIGPSGFPAVLA